MNIQLLEKEKIAEVDRKSYILTFDLGKKIELFRGVGLNTPNADDVFFREFGLELRHRMQNFFPNATMWAVSMDDLAVEIVGAAHRNGILKHSFAVSTCVEIASRKQGYPLDITRIVDVNGKTLGIGARPGCADIDCQMADIRQLAEGKPIVLMEDGAFTGSTILHTLQKFQEHHVFVSAVVLGFAFKRALAKIKQSYHGEVVVIEELGDCIDWMPDHDFIPFAPNCGRVMGVSWGKQVMPVYSHDGISFSVPYLQSFCPMSDWTSIPEEKAIGFSLFCAQQALQLFRLLDQMNGKELGVGDFIDIYPRVSMPVSVGHDCLPHAEWGITEYLNELCHILA